MVDIFVGVLAPDVIQMSVVLHQVYRALLGVHLREEVVEVLISNNFIRSASEKMEIEGLLLQPIVSINGWVGLPIDLQISALAVIEPMQLSFPVDLYPVEHIIDGASSRLMRNYDTESLQINSVFFLVIPTETLHNQEKQFKIKPTVINQNSDQFRHPVRDN